MDTSRITSQSSLTETKQASLTQTGLHFTYHLNSPDLHFLQFCICLWDTWPDCTHYFIQRTVLPSPGLLTFYHGLKTFSLYCQIRIACLAAVQQCEQLLHRMF